MSEAKLSAVWEIKDFATARLTQHSFESGELLDLHPALVSSRGESWLFLLQLSSDTAWAGFWAVPIFADARSFQLASYNAVLLGEDNRFVDCVCCSLTEFSSCPDCRVDPLFGGKAKAFPITDVNKAVRKDGSLRIRIDLTFSHNRASLMHDCAGVRDYGFRSIAVGDFSVKVHKRNSALAKICPALADKIANGIAGSVLTLRDVCPAAFKSIYGIIYNDNWDFLSDIDLTQKVLDLAVQYDAELIRRRCDEHLAAKVNEANALDILIKNAVLLGADDTFTVCLTILAQHPEFQQSQVWLDFKKRYRFEPEAILQRISGHAVAAKRVTQQWHDVLKRPRERPDA